LSTRSALAYAACAPTRQQHPNGQARVVLQRRQHWRQQRRRQPLEPRAASARRTVFASAQAKSTSTQRPARARRASALRAQCCAFQIAERNDPKGQNSHQPSPSLFGNMAPSVKALPRSRRTNASVTRSRNTSAAFLLLFRSKRRSYAILSVAGHNDDRCLLLHPVCCSLLFTRPKLS
jgi:hypothetical protein